MQLTPQLAEILTGHVDRLRRTGHPTGLDAYLAPNLRGSRLSRQRAGSIVKTVAQLTNQQLLAQHRPPMANITPHSLRRTYISIALLANNFDVKWVMSQVGHADSRMTLDVSRPATGLSATLSHMEIGVRDLRNRTAQVVDAVRAGDRVTLTVRGEPVADIVPHVQRVRWLSGARLRDQLEHRAADPALRSELEALVGQTLEEL